MKSGPSAADIYGAVEGADVVLLSIPFPAVAKLPNDLFNRAAEGVVIIDTGNYYPDVRDPRIAGDRRRHAGKRLDIAAAWPPHFQGVQ